MDFNIKNTEIFKNIVEKIVDVRLQKKGITSFVAAKVTAVNSDGTVNVVIPPDNKRYVNNILNKTNEVLSVGDSVELNTKNGKLSNAWVALRHGNNPDGVLEKQIDDIKENVSGLQGEVDDLYPEVITIYNADEQSMLTTDNYDVIELPTVYSQHGSKLTIAKTTGLTQNASGVKIPAGYSRALVSAVAQFNNKNTTSDMYFVLYVQRCRNEAATILARSMTPSVSKGLSASAAIPTIQLWVQEGDVLYLRAFKSISNGVAAVGAGVRTYLTVELLK